MNVVFHAAYGNRFHLVLPRDAPEVRPKALLQLGRDEFLAFLGAEDAMHMTTGKRMHVLAFLSSLTGLGFLLCSDPSDESLGYCRSSLRDSMLSGFGSSNSSTRTNW